MDSLKMFKGYDKVEHNQHHHLGDQQRNPNPKPKSSKTLIATISIFAILFFALMLTIVFTLLHHTNTHSQQQPQQHQQPDSPESIRVICNVTRFPDSCLAAIPPSSTNATDPEAILALSLRASIHALSNLTFSLGTAEGVADCKDQIDDAVSRLNDSLSVMATPPKLTEAKIADIQTWVSAAMTDQQTCLDGLEEIGDVAGLEEMKKLMQRSSEYTSNSLAIVANIRNLLQLFHMPLH